jgi:hypothetical protein
MNQDNLSSRVTKLRKELKETKAQLDRVEKSFGYSYHTLTPEERQGFLQVFNQHPKLFEGHATNTGYDSDDTCDGEEPPPSDTVEFSVLISEFRTELKNAFKKLGSQSSCLNSENIREFINNVHTVVQKMYKSPC